MHWRIGHTRPLCLLRVFFHVKHHSIYQTVCVIMDKCWNSYGAKIVINSNNSCLKYTLQYNLDNDLFSFKTFNTLSNL